MTKGQAKAAGLKPLTNVFRRNAVRALAKACAEFIKRGIEFEIVECKSGQQLWAKPQPKPKPASTEWKSLFYKTRNGEPV